MFVVLEWVKEEGLICCQCSSHESEVPGRSDLSGVVNRRQDTPVFFVVVSRRYDKPDASVGPVDEIVVVVVVVAVVMVVVVEDSFFLVVVLVVVVVVLVMSCAG